MDHFLDKISESINLNKGIPLTITKKESGNLLTLDLKVCEEFHSFVGMLSGPVAFYVLVVFMALTTLYFKISGLLS